MECVCCENGQMCVLVCGENQRESKERRYLTPPSSVPIPLFLPLTFPFSSPTPFPYSQHVIDAYAQLSSIPPPPFIIIACDAYAHPPAIRADTRSSLPLPHQGPRDY